MVTWFLGMALAKLEWRQEGIEKRGKEKNVRRKWKEKEELNQWVLMIVTGALSKGGKGGGRGRRMERGVAKGR